MSRPGITQTIITDRYVVAAHAVANKARDDFSPKQIIAARHMANEGATVRDIHAALGWTCNEANALLRLKKFGIKPRTKRGRALRGTSGLSLSAHGRDSFNQSDYRPKRVAE